MSTTENHTPNQQEWFTEKSKGGALHILDAEQRWIATTTDEHAPLIVAAPALLAALIRLLEWTCNPGEDDGPENDAVMLQADAAIAKVQP